MKRSVTILSLIIIVSTVFAEARPMNPRSQAEMESCPSEVVSKYKLLIGKLMHLMDVKIELLKKSLSDESLSPEERKAQQSLQLELQSEKSRSETAYQAVLSSQNSSQTCIDMQRAIELFDGKAN